MTSFWPVARCPAKKPWSSNASRLSGRNSPLDARPLKDARAERIRNGTDQPPITLDFEHTGRISGGHADRIGRYEPAATVAGFAFTPLTALELSTAITHLRDVLGDQTYESLARKGEAMTTAAMATYAYDQIDQARTTLEQPS